MKYLINKRVSKKFQLIFSVAFCFSLLVWSCKNNSTLHASHGVITQNGNEISCHINTDSLLGRSYFDNRFIQNVDAIVPNPDSAKSKKGMVLIKGGVFEMGADAPEGFNNMPISALAQNDEYPKHTVEVSSFYMDEHEVTIREYMEFVKATHYKTVAEYDIDWNELKKQVPPDTPKPHDSLLKAGAVVFKYVPKSTQKDNLGNWWTFTKGASWKNPDGKNLDINTLLDLPVTQISWYDALAYAKWVGKRLPTEAEYEYAMRGGLNNNMYPWGNEKLEKGVYKGNFLQGEFPYQNTGEDGFKFLAPIKSFPPNNYGLYDIAGNVWEWTQDWYSASYYLTLKNNNTIAVNPQGPEKSFEVYEPYATNKVVRGGSFLCNDGWCSGYRNSRRMRLGPDSAMQHLGFRCVRDAKDSK